MERRGGVGGGTFTNTGTIKVAGGAPNLRTLLRDAGTILHGDAYLDFDASGGKVQVLNGGLYEVVTPSNNYGLRQFADGYGVAVESGGVFRVSGAGAFFANVGNAPTFNVNGGTVEVMGGCFTSIRAALSRMRR